MSRRNIVDWISRVAREEPSRVAMRFAPHEVSYAAMDRRIAELAALLKTTYALQRGDRIAWLGLNHPEQLAILFACAAAGVIFVPLNWRLSVAEMNTILADCAPRALMCEPEFEKSGAQLAHDRALPLFMLRSQEGEVWLQHELVDVAPTPAPTLPKTEGDLLLLLYTSGTTGFPKGAAHTHEGTDYNSENAQHAYEFTPADNVLVNLPLFHVGGTVMLALPALRAGAMVTIHRRFDPAQTLREIEQGRVTFLLLVATMMKALYDHASWSSTDLSSLRLVMTGASKIPDTMLKPFFDRGVVASQAYGATEMGVGAYLPARDALRKIGCVGIGTMHRHMRLVREDGAEVKQGEVGEFTFGGPGVMAGYWGNREATDACIRDGIFYTGDLGVADEDGYATIVGRRKEMIISGGENIYPAELENVLGECADVVECAVVGLPDERWGEVPVAFVVGKEGCDLSADKVLALLRASVSGYKLPREIFFTPDLPRNAMGKIVRADLRRQAESRVQSRNANKGI